MDIPASMKRPLYNAASADSKVLKDLFESLWSIGWFWVVQQDVWATNDVRRYCN